MTIRITVARSFEKALRSLPPDRQRRAAAALRKFADEPGLKGLDFRPLAGSPPHFIINPTRGDRIVLRRDAEDLYTAVDVGPHDNVYRRWDR